MYGRNAAKLVEALRACVQLPPLEYVVNEAKPPRRMSFQVVLHFHDVDDEPPPPVELWSGIEKTPRAAKFPEPDVIIDAIKEYL